MIKVSGTAGAFEMFAQHFYTHENPGDAFRFAFPYAISGVSSDEITRSGHYILRKPHIQKRLKDIAYNNLSVHTRERDQLIKWGYACMSVNINSYMTVHKGCCRYCYGYEHQYQWTQNEYLRELNRWQIGNNPKKPEPMPDIAGGFGFLMTNAPSLDCPECAGEGVERFEIKDTEQLSDVELFMLKKIKRTKDGFDFELQDKLEVFKIVIKLMGLDETKVSIQHDIRHLVAAIETSKDDPHQMARIYQDMLAAT